MSDDILISARDLSVGFSLYYREAERSESSFQTTEFGFNPQISFPLGPDTRLSLNYELVSEEIRDTIAGTTSPVIIAEDPLTCVARGCAGLLEDLDAVKQILDTTGD